MPNGENGIHFLKDVTSFKGRPIEIDPGFKFDVIRYKIRKLNTFDSYLELLHKRTPVFIPESRVGKIHYN